MNSCILIDAYKLVKNDAADILRQIAGTLQEGTISTGLPVPLPFCRYVSVAP